MEPEESSIMGISAHLFLVYIGHAVPTLKSCGCSTPFGSNVFVMDAPSIIIELSADGHSKTVTDRLGESRAFRTLMDRILEISHAQCWLQDPRHASGGARRHGKS